MKRLIALSAVALLTACGSIMHGTSQDIGISSSPSNAEVSIDGMSKGHTPVIANLSRKDNHIVKLALPGYAPAELTLTRGVSGWVWGNLVFGGVIGLGVDAISGGLYKLSPEQLTGALAKESASIRTEKDGIYVVLVQRAEPGWTKVGQLKPLTSGMALGE
ncbi:MAG: PEGA domain-containing protein [Thermoanaerobaculia bacterium]